MDVDTILAGYKKIQNGHKVRHTYHCWTCRKIGNNVICLPIAKLDHSNHVVTYAGIDKILCLCGQVEYLKKKINLSEPNGKFICNFLLFF